MLHLLLISYLSFTTTSGVLAAKPFANVHWKKGASRTTWTGTTQDVQVQYGNGPLLSNVQVQPIYWGTKVKYNYDAYYNAIVQESPFLQNLAQYNVNATTNLTKGTLTSGITNEQGETEGVVNAYDVTAYIKRLVDAGQLDPTKGNLYVPVHFGEVLILGNDGSGINTASCSDWCAYHWFVQTSKGPVAYGIIPEQTFSQCATGMCQVPTGNAFGDNCVVASHELVEAMTDPQPFTGWVSNAEIGDYCSGTFLPSAFCGKDGYEYYVQQVWSNEGSHCVEPVGGRPSSCPNGFGTGAKGHKSHASSSRVSTKTKPGTASSTRTKNATTTHTHTKSKSK